MSESAAKIQAEIEDVVHNGAMPSDDLMARVKRLIDVDDPRRPIEIKTFQWAKNNTDKIDGIDIVFGNREYSYLEPDAAGKLSRQLEHAFDEHPPKDVVLRMMKRYEPFIEGGATAYLEDGESFEIAGIEGIHPNHDGFYFSRPVGMNGYAAFNKVTHIVPNGSAK